MSEQNIKDIIKQEYVKCASDPVHFFRKYCYITHPLKGRILFHLYPFQEKVLYQFQKNNYNIDDMYTISAYKSYDISSQFVGYVYSCDISNVELLSSLTSILYKNIHKDLLTINEYFKDDKLTSSSNSNASSNTSFSSSDEESPKNIIINNSTVLNNKIINPIQKLRIKKNIIKIFVGLFIIFICN